MGIRIFHTADLHLGMKFTRGYAAAVQERLIEARFETLQAMAAKASLSGCDMFVIAGDLFDSQRIAKKDVLRAAQALKSFEGKLVLVLPGNHDYIQKEEENLWRWFKSAMSERTLLLEDAKPYDLKKYDLDVVVYAAPCTAKHSGVNAIGWVKAFREEWSAESHAPGALSHSRHAVDKGGEESEPGWGRTEESGPLLDAEAHPGNNDRVHIGIAHGSLEGLSPDFNQDYYPMTEEELEAAGLDLWLMGHTHVRYPDRDSGTEGLIFFPSTPEPDGFDCRHPGQAWLIEVGDDKEVSFQSVQTGKYRFVSKEIELSGEEDLFALTAAFDEEKGKRDLIKLKLAGRLGGEAYDTRASVIEEIEKRVLHLEVDLSELYREITSADIDREFTDGSFPHKLLTALAEDQANPLSLQMAYDFIRKARS